MNDAGAHQVQQVKEDCRESLHRELEDLPTEHVKTVLHHARALKEIAPERAQDSPDSNGLEKPAPPKRDLVWTCSHCGTEIDRTEDIPDECPNCGAPRDELSLREEAA